MTKKEPLRFFTRSLHFSQWAKFCATQAGFGWAPGRGGRGRISRSPTHYKRLYAAAHIQRMHPHAFPTDTRL